MKKFTTYILLLALLFSMLLFSGCGVGCFGGRNADLSYNEKYYRTDVGNTHYNTEAIEYYIFKTNGTGEYVYDETHDSYKTTNDNIKITFKYTFVDNKVCLFYYSSNTEKKSDWYRSFYYSKDMLLKSTDPDSFVYANEDFLKEIPNFV